MLIISYLGILGILGKCYLLLYWVIFQNFEEFFPLQDVFKKFYCICYMYNNLIFLEKQGSQCHICSILIIINIG